MLTFKLHRPELRLLRRKQLWRVLKPAFIGALQPKNPVAIAIWLRHSCHILHLRARAHWSPGQRKKRSFRTSPEETPISPDLRQNPRQALPQAPVEYDTIQHFTPQLLRTRMAHTESTPPHLPTTRQGASIASSEWPQNLMATIQHPKHTHHIRNRRYIQAKASSHNTRGECYTINGYTATAHPQPPASAPHAPASAAAAQDMADE